jgi:hypothetical protein
VREPGLRWNTGEWWDMAGRPVYGPGTASVLEKRALVQHGAPAE